MQRRSSPNATLSDSLRTFEPLRNSGSRDLDRQDSDNAFHKKRELLHSNPADFQAPRSGSLANAVPDDTNTFSAAQRQRMVEGSDGLLHIDHVLDITTTSSSLSPPLDPCEAGWISQLHTAMRRGAASPFRLAPPSWPR